MILLLDIGNTRLKWGRLVNGAVGSGEAVAHGGDAEAVLAGWTQLPRPDAVVAVSVAGAAVTSAVCAWVARNWRMDVRLIRSAAAAAGVQNGYAEPERLGPDRWAAVVGAYTASRRAVCVADCGSALTIDAVDASGRHRGGLIVPGRQLMRRALHSGTAALPLVDAAAARLFGTDTASAIAGGTLLGLVAMVDELSRRMAAALDGEVDLWLTGGDAPVLLPHLRGRFRHAPDLVLQGLAALANEE